MLKQEYNFSTKTLDNKCLPFIINVKANSSEEAITKAKDHLKNIHLNNEILIDKDVTNELNTLEEIHI